MHENHGLHDYVVDGYRGISYVDADGIEQNATIRLVSHHPDENELLAVQQVTVRTAEHDASTSCSSSTDCPSCSSNSSKPDRSTPI